MPFIQNVSLDNIVKGFHKDPGSNSVLIQILDPAFRGIYEPFHDFKEIYEFNFYDSENEFDEGAITHLDAKLIANILVYAFDNDMNVIVHCHAGKCRSGAVCDAGVAFGFEDTGSHRTPNLLVKYKVLEALGLSLYNK